MSEIQSARPVSSLTFSEIAQQIVDYESANNDNLAGVISEMSAEVIRRHADISELKNAIYSVDAEAEKAITEYESNPKTEREKALKRVLHKKIVLLLISTGAHSDKVYETQSRAKKEQIKNLHEIIEKLIKVSGKLLNIAKTSNQHMPYVITLVRHIIDLSKAYNIFIPTSYYLLYAMNQISKISSSSIPLLAVPSTCVKVQEKYVNSTVYREYVLNNCLDLLVCSLQQYSNSVSFPEFSAFIVSEIKRIRNSPNKSSAWINAKIETVAKTAKNHAETIKSLRQTLSAVDEEAIARIEKKIPILQIDIK